MKYPDTALFINGQWQQAQSGETISVANPATGEAIGVVAKASVADLDLALAAAGRAFETWRATSPLVRSNIMRRAADRLRQQAEQTATILTMEQGKPFSEAMAETLSAADIIDWFAEEARRSYGRVIPARADGIYQLVVKEPVGPVAAFTPWNFPLNQVVRKVSAAIAAGCSIIVKGPEETPASPAALIACFAEAGLPDGVINLVYGSPAEISSYLIPHPVIRKVSFTGSVAVGKQLAAMAGQHMKRATMELGGHGPALVFDDADLPSAVDRLVFSKFRNAGQVCVAPTRFLVQEGVYDAFVEEFATRAAALKLGSGLDSETKMGPLINDRRVKAVESLVSDAVAKGAGVATGGRRVGNVGSFYEPTVLTGLTTEMSVMQEEPFGPLALMIPFRDLDEAVAEANRLPYGLAAYAWTGSARTSTLLGQRIESGMLTINHLGLALPETPFGGVKDSGYGSEGGVEAMEAYLNVKFVSQAAG
ncbi:NAD-dependent succinate-semialdehyde dehydrogenase [Acidisoma cellulosilytica]|uniref:NAD-dependent succinate-semialdehyde dehydrogenase n=1 Tax=Acidisoma cellulosilyticum TaxID=2802395 RepID=A0A964E784_9PROT|nr:NAD-dependent succinate-semialdehyde dehydrogenase [Acidisoma cellulosilyticum]MCB8883743.1 NAD-dependent succinate-semialdehyde dehydrogenase [Acidisoma cellulosilyticum]